MAKICLNDISPQVLKKVVLENSLMSGPLITICSVGFLGGVLALIFSSLAFSLMFFSSGILISGAIFSANYWGRKDTFELRYLEELNKDAQKKQQKKLDDLEKDIINCLKFTNNDKYVKQTHKQFITIGEKFKTFQQILLKKFDSKELTFTRFFSTAEQTYSAILDNIELSVTSYIALKDIDIDYLEEKFVELKKQIESGESEKFDLEEFKAIQDRIDLRESKFSEIDEILSKNEKAITELDNLSFNLSSTKTYAGRAKQDLDKTLEDLINLINSVNKYKID